jgi:hypothetical protein
MISAELARSRVSQTAARPPALPRVWRTVCCPRPPGASRAWVTSVIIMLHEQTQVAKCMWPQAAHIDTPYDTRHARATHKYKTHKLNHGREGSARRIRGNRAVRRRLRRSIAEAEGGARRRAAAGGGDRWTLTEGPFGQWVAGLFLKYSGTRVVLPAGA